LQESRVAGVGQDASESVDVRVIAATNRDLESAVRGTAFRADLFHRLDILSLHIPPLRDRPEDLQPLVEHFARKYRALGEGGDQTVSPEVIDALSLAPLPGNIRQLENLIRKI